jgi:hypothetical protein
MGKPSSSMRSVPITAVDLNKRRGKDEDGIQTCVPAQRRPNFYRNCYLRLNLQEAWFVEIWYCFIADPTRWIKIAVCLYTEEGGWETPRLSHLACLVLVKSHVFSPSFPYSKQYWKNRFLIYYNNLMNVSKVPDFYDTSSHIKMLKEWTESINVLLCTPLKSNSGHQDSRQ